MTKVSDYDFYRERAIEDDHDLPEGYDSWEEVEEDERARRSEDKYDEMSRRYYRNLTQHFNY